MTPASYNYEQILKLAQGGLTSREIQVELGCSRGTVQRALKKSGVDLTEVTSLRVSEDIRERIGGTRDLLREGEG